MSVSTIIILVLVLCCVALAVRLVIVQREKRPVKNANPMWSGDVDPSPYRYYSFYLVFQHRDEMWWQAFMFLLAGRPVGATSETLGAMADEALAQYEKRFPGRVLAPRDLAGVEESERLLRNPQPPRR